MPRPRLSRARIAAILRKQAPALGEGWETLREYQIAMEVYRRITLALTGERIPVLTCVLDPTHPTHIGPCAAFHVPCPVIGPRGHVFPGPSYDRHPCLCGTPYPGAK